SRLMGKDVMQTPARDGPRRSAEQKQRLNAAGEGRRRRERSRASDGQQPRRRATSEGRSSSERRQQATTPFEPSRRVTVNEDRRRRQGKLQQLHNSPQEATSRGNSNRRGQPSQRG